MKSTIQELTLAFLNNVHNN